MIPLWLQFLSTLMFTNPFLLYYRRHFKTPLQYILNRTPQILLPINDSLSEMHIGLFPQ